MDATTMNTISGIGSREASVRVSSSTGKASAVQPPTGLPVEDTVELSPAGMALSRADVQSRTRFARICEVRADIKAETFETPKRVNETVKRLLKVIG